jgi:hypothetical protein
VDDGGRQILERAPIGQPVGESSRRRPHPPGGLGRRARQPRRYALRAPLRGRRLARPKPDRTRNFKLHSRSKSVPLARLKSVPPFGAGAGRKVGHMVAGCRLRIDPSVGVAAASRVACRRRAESRCRQPTPPTTASPRPCFSAPRPTAIQEVSQSRQRDRAARRGGMERDRPNPAVRRSRRCESATESAGGIERL